MNKKLLLMGALGAMALMGPAQAADPAWTSKQEGLQPVLEARHAQHSLQSATAKMAAKTGTDATSVGKTQALKTGYVDRTDIKNAVYYGKHDGGLMIDKQMAAVQSAAHDVFLSSSPGIVAAQDPLAAKQMATLAQVQSNFRSTGMINGICKPDGATLAQTATAASVDG